MASNAVVMKQKHKFDIAPLEMGYRDYGIFPNHILMNLGQELDFKANKEKAFELSKPDKKQKIEMALAQHKELQERY
jgi:hypothetical protein